VVYHFACKTAGSNCCIQKLVPSAELVVYQTPRCPSHMFVYGVVEPHPTPDDFPEAESQNMNAGIHITAGCALISPNRHWRGQLMLQVLHDCYRSELQTVQDKVEGATASGNVQRNGAVPRQHAVTSCALRSAAPSSRLQWPASGQ